MTGPKKSKQNITIEDARIIFRNFEGKGDKYNVDGRRNFCVLLDDDIAGILAKDGWNIRKLSAREEGDQDQPYMQVSVSYKARPPKIVLISETTKRRTYIDEDTVHILDWADIAMVDMIISPYHWDVSGKQGIKAYLKKMFVTLEEDELELKYAEDGLSEDDSYSDPDQDDEDPF